MNNENTWTQGGKHHILGSIVRGRGGIVGERMERDNVGKNVRYR